LTRNHQHYVLSRNIKGTNNDLKTAEEFKNKKPELGFDLAQVWLPIFELFSATFQVSTGLILNNC
jgi:hypothetical protein